MIGQCKLSSAVVWVGFQPSHQRGVEGDSANHQLLCVCCREGVQFWSTAHLLSRVTHPAETAANEHHEELQARQLAVAGAAEFERPRSEPLDMRPPAVLAVADHASTVATDLDTPRPQPRSPPAAAMNTDEDTPPPGSSLRALQISRRVAAADQQPSSEEAKVTPEPEPEPEPYSSAASAAAAAGADAHIVELLHSAAATPVASPARAEDAGVAALAARRALVKVAAHSDPAPHTDCSPLQPFASPSEANFGNPLAFASVLVNSNRRREEAGDHVHQHGADAPPGDDTPAVAAPQMNSTLRLAAQLNEIKKQRPAAEAIAQIRSTARPKRDLLNFSMDDRKYGCLTPLDPTPEEVGPNADLPPVRRPPR